MTQTFPSITADTDADIRISNPPPPPNCSHLILPVLMIKALRQHPLGRDLYLRGAGYYASVSRRFECHALPYYAILYCTGGGMTLQAQGTSWRVSSGDMIIVPPGFSHVSTPPQDKPWSYFWVTYEGLLGATYTDFLNVPNLVAHVGLNPDLISEFESLCALRTSDFTLDVFLDGANRLRGLLTRIALSISNQQRGEGGRINLGAIRRVMANRLDGSVSLDDLAQAANLSPRHFARSFKQMTGLSPMRYYAQMRIQRACHLLDVSRAPINQISHSLGYEDQLYFSRIFRKVIGISPQAYRKLNSR